MSASGTKRTCRPALTMSARQGKADKQASSEVMDGDMSTTFGAGFHAAPGKAVDASAYERWTGRWSRLFIPAVLAAAAVGPKCRVLDVSTGTGEPARMALPLV